MANWLTKAVKLMKRPESKLAAGVALMGLAIAMLVNVSLVSCEELGGGRATAAGGSGPGRPEDKAAVAPAAAGARKADFRLSTIIGEPEMRVRVQAGVSVVRLGGVKELVIAPSGPDGRPVGSGDRCLGDLEIRRESGAWLVGSGAAARRMIGDAGLVAASALPGQGLAVNGTVHPGRVRLVARSELGSQAFDVVEHIPLEQYLPGVVAKEMPAGWPLGAYQVQAVCARSYALHEKMRCAAGGGGGRSHFDVESSDRDQVYSGATTNRAAIEAVRSTRGWVLADGDQLLRAYFSSTCGGRTASARDTWPTGPGFEFNLAAPIQAQARESACESSPLYRWSVTRDRMELVRRLRTYGERSQMMVRRIKDLWSIEPMLMNADGRPCRFKVTEPGGAWYQLSGEQLRLALNQSVPVGGGGGAVEGEGAAEWGGLVGPVATSQGYGEPAAMGSVGGFAAAAVAVPDVDRKSRVASSDVEVVGPRGGDKVTINGRGFGHGVGMCQYCAKAFAERGEDWRSAVLRFYPGARLASVY